MDIFNGTALFYKLYGCLQVDMVIIEKCTHCMTEDCKEKTINHPKLILNFQIFFLNIFMLNFQFPDFIKEKLTQIMQPKKS